MVVNFVFRPAPEGNVQSQYQDLSTEYLRVDT